MKESIVAIGVCGGSGAGKTTLAKAIYRALYESVNVAYIVHDNYYKDISHKSFEDRVKTNFDHPDSLDTSLLINHIKDLKNGIPVEVPTYDFSSHTRTNEILLVEPKKVILVEGILIFSNEELVELLDVKVFVDAADDIRLVRRIERDIDERGRETSQVLQQYEETVRPMHREYVEPSKEVADFIYKSDNTEAKNENKNGANIDETIVVKMIVTYLKTICEIY